MDVHCVCMCRLDLICPHWIDSTGSFAFLRSYSYCELIGYIFFSTNGPFYLQQKISWSHEYLLHFNVPFGNVFYLQFTLLDVRIYYKLYTNASFLLLSNFNYYHSHLLLEYSNSCLSYIRKEVSNLIGMEIWLSNRVFRALAEDQTSLTSMHTWKLKHL